MIGEIINHLWQSTIFAVAVALIAVAYRNNRAGVRYWLWLSASLKFLIPFSLFVGLGASVWHALPAAENIKQIAAPAVSATMVEFTEPFPETFTYVPAPVHHQSNWIPAAIFAVWAFGFLCVALMRFRGWLRIMAAVRASTPIDIATKVPVRSSPILLEPGVVGFLNPILLMPEGILKNLTPPQLEAIIAHELCHIRRRDNLTSAFHMLVETIFWFYPIVWWIGAKLVQERESACDEGVLALGNKPEVYAAGILNVCKSYIESPLRCVSGVTGSDLKRRVRAILTGRAARNLSFRRKAVLAAAGIVTLAVPIVIGAMRISALRVPSQILTASDIAPKAAMIASAAPNSIDKVRATSLGTDRQQSQTKLTSSPKLITPADPVTAASVVPFTPIRTRLPWYGVQANGEDGANGMNGDGTANDYVDENSKHDERPVVVETVLKPKPNPEVKPDFKYDIVSFSPHDRSNRVFSMPSLPFGSFSASGVALHQLIELAYGPLSPFQYSQIYPDMTKLNREKTYDIEAAIAPSDVEAFHKISSNDQKDWTRRLVQHILADRFNLQVHLETRIVPVYWLVVSDPGKLQRAEGDCNPEQRQPVPNCGLVFFLSGPHTRPESIHSKSSKRHRRPDRSTGDQQNRPDRKIRSQSGLHPGYGILRKSSARIPSN
jgi:beta-lactamase regulating signal transducer with metallopeptidase domain